jgi:hypothetical protein
MEKGNILIGLIVGACTMVGTAFTIDNRYAKTSDMAEVNEYVQQVDKRLEIKILKDRANALQERMWKIEDRYGDDVSKMPKDKRDQYRKIKKEYDEIMEKIKE